MASYHRHASPLTRNQPHSESQGSGLSPTLRLKAIAGALLFGASIWAGILYLVLR